MSPEADTPVEPCTDCDKTRIEKTLEAEEAKRASERDVEKLKLEKQLDGEEATRASERDVEKLELEKQLEADAANETVAADLLKSRWQSEAELAKLFHETIAEVAKGSIERSRDSAKYVQTAATAIALVYTTLLGLVFSVTDNPLPVRGVYAGVFLGLAIALATAYLAFITRPRPPSMYPGGSSLSELQLYRTGYLTKWINATVHDRRWAIRASVLSLAVGVAFIPAAFVATSRPATIPDAPVAPTIPAAIDATITDEAAALFHAQVRGFRAATTARNEAITKASEQATTATDDESSVNRTAFRLALAGLLTVFLGPLLFAKLRHEGSSADNPDSSPIEVVPLL